MYVVKFSDNSTTSTGYFTTVTLLLFKDGPKVAVVFDLNM
jgi:hypothetical protein